jgi:hypothetical protein
MSLKMKEAMRVKSFEGKLESQCCPTALVFQTLAQVTPSA